jgi:N4-gp56 family major capsid protein
MASFTGNPTSTSVLWSSTLLTAYITKEIQTLEPNLVFANFGVKQDVPKGYHTLAFPQTVQILSTAVSSITEGTNPTAYIWNSTAYTSTVTQYGIVVQITDILARNSAIDTINSCTRQIRAAVSRQLDNYLQSTVNGSSVGVIYAGGRATRAALGAGDLFDTALYTKGIKNLRSVNNAGVKPFANGAYAVVMDPATESDFMNNTNAGGWLDLARYSDPEALKAGKGGHFRGGMIYTSPNVQTFSSTITAHPVTFIGQESFGWGFYQPITPTLINTPDHGNPLNLFTSIGAKFGAGVTLFEVAAANYRVARAECAVS